MSYKLCRGCAGDDSNCYKDIQYRFTFKHTEQYPLGLKSVSFFGPHKNVIKSALKSRSANFARTGKFSDDEMKKVETLYNISVQVSESFANGRAGAMDIYMKETWWHAVKGIYGEPMQINFYNAIQIPRNTWVEVLFQLNGPKTATLEEDSRGVATLSAINEDGDIIPFKGLHSSGQLVSAEFVKLAKHKENIYSM